MIVPRLVLDTNVLLSSLLFRSGSPVWIRRAWQSDAIRPLASRDSVEELVRVLSYPKFRLTEGDHRELLDDYLPWCETVSVPASMTAPLSRDPSDQPFLALALFAEADALITGAQDLLAMAQAVSVPILTPAAFRQAWPNLREPAASTP